MKRNDSKITRPLSYLEGLKKLTPREIEVLDLIERGYTNKEIAGVLNLSVRTVNSHKENIKKKLGLSGRNAIRKWLWAVKNGDPGTKN